MNTIQRKRTIRFAKFLMTRVERKRFYLGSIVTMANSNDTTQSCDVTKALSNGCGTVGCAMGHLGRFNPRRFDYYLDWLDNDDNEGYFYVRDKQNPGMAWNRIAENYFGFTESEVDFLFTLNGNYKRENPTPRDVGLRILGLLKKSKKVMKEYNEHVN